MRLQSHLLLLTLGTLLPMVVFGIVATMLIASREETVFRRGATERTLAVLTAVDTELTGYVKSLQTLATSPSLERDDLRAFHEEVGRLLEIQPNWRGISLAGPDGQRVTSVPAPFGTALSTAVDRPSFDEVLATERPAIGNLVLEDGTYQFSARVPVTDDDRVKYVLTALIQPNSIVELLTAQRLPADWVGVVLDGNGNIIARTVSQDALLGRAASESLRVALDGAAEGWFQGRTLEGADVYTPFTRSAFSRWTVAIGIPATAVEEGVYETIWLLGSGISAALSLTFLLAAALAQRISRPITSLASVAKAIRSGTPISPPAAASRVDEVREVTEALIEAGEAAREREQALQVADRAKDEFLAMLAHELRNPLGALSSSVQVLQMTGPSTEAARTATDILGRQIQHMTRLVDDLLEVSRATSGKIILTRRPLDIGHVAANFVQTLRSAGNLDRHDVVVEASEVWADADEARIEQILSNLLANAIKFTPAGGRIAVRTRRLDGYAVLEVSDTGIGLSAELTPRIFDLFVQGEQSLDRGLGGLGIGLTLVKRLAEMQDGDASAASEGLGRGARFTVRFPAIEAPAETSGDSTHATVQGSRNVLLIEDNEDARRTLRTALALYGYDVEEAADGPGGIRSAAETRCEVAIIDIGLPGIDGYEVAARLRESHGPALLLIALTGYGDDQSRRRALQAGFDAYFTKPVSPASLAEFIEAARTSADSAGRSSTG